MLEKIFRLLPPRDLRSAVLVCRRWREVGETPRLWPWVTITVSSDNISEMPELLRRRRMQNAVTSWQHLE